MTDNTKNTINQGKKNIKHFSLLIVLALIILSIMYLQSQKAGVKITNTSPNSSSNNPQANFSANYKDAGKNSKYPMAPDFVGIEKWINSEPLNIAQLKGNVVLVDFWTYTCINCIRTLPYLKEWDKKYRDKGLVIVGVHTPEFEFEKKYDNVLKAVKDYNLKYPVAQDNNYVTWSLYQNRYWPHKYLIDIDGRIRYDHIGEGNYEETEMQIQKLLKERMQRMGEKASIDGSTSHPSDMINSSFYDIRTPEIYFGYQFTRGNLGNADSAKPEDTEKYILPKSISQNSVYLEGEWKNNADNMELESDEGSILLIFNSKSVNIVAGSEKGSKLYAFLDNEAESNKNKGSDITIEKNESTSEIKEFRLYNIGNAQNYDTHSINLKVKGKGFKIYTFTFG